MWTSAQHGNAARSIVALVAVAASSWACTPRYALRGAEAATNLQWPPAPGKAKLTYVRSLTGVAADRGSGSALKTFVYGRGKEDPNSFVLPAAVAAGADGRLAIADVGRKCVHLYLPAQRRYVRVAGSKDEPLVSPVGVIFDDDLRLYVTDSAGKVQAFGADGRILFTLKKAGAKALKRPTGIAYSPRTRRLYVVDTLDDEVHAFTTNGELSFSFGRRGDEDGAFNHPTHIFWAAPGELYVTDSLNFRVGVFDESGRFLGGFGRHGDGSGDLALPKGLAVDRDGVVYVADAFLDNVQLFSRKGEFLETLGRRGVGEGEFWLPSGVFVSANDELYVCDTYNRRIQVFRITEKYAEQAH